MKKFLFGCAIIMMMAAVVMTTSCSEEFSTPRPEGETEPAVVVSVTNNQGHSNAVITYGDVTAAIEINLDKKTIQVEEEELGKAALLSAPRAQDGTSHTWSDSQVGHISIKNSNSSKLELFLMAESSAKADINGKTAQIVETYQIWYKTSKMETAAQLENGLMNPWYLQTTSDKDDVVVVKTDTTFTITTTVSSSQVTGSAAVKYPIVEVDKANIGKVTFLNEEKTTTPLSDGFVLAVAQKFNDSQVATTVATCRHDDAARAWVEVTEIKYVTYYPTLSANIADIKLKEVITWEGRGTLAGRSGEIELFPTYRQKAKEEIPDDGITFTVTDGVGKSTGTGRTTVSASTLDVTITLGKTQIEVDANKLGVVNLSNAGSVSFANISSGSQTGKKGTRNFSFSDGQTANAVWQWLYAATAASHLELETIDFSKAEISNKTSESCTVTLVFTGTVKTVGKVSKTKAVTFRPTYRQVVKEDEWSVLFEDNIDNSSPTASQYTTATVYKNGEKVAQKRYRTAVCGHIEGLTQITAKSTSVDKSGDGVREDTSPDWTGLTTGTSGEVVFELQKTSKIHHFRRSFTSDGGGPVHAVDGEYRFMTSTFTVKVNGKVIGQKSYVPSTQVTVDKLEQVSGKDHTLTKGGHTYTYGGSWILTIENRIDGKIFQQSQTATDIYVY